MTRFEVSSALVGAAKMLLGAWVGRWVCLQRAGVLPRTSGVSLLWSGVCELPTEAATVHYIRLPSSWRQGLHGYAPPA